MWLVFTRNPESKTLKPKESLEQIYNFNCRIYMSFDKIYLCLPV